MIADTSALVAMLRLEPGHLRMKSALADGAVAIPAPAIVEFHRVTRMSGNQPDPLAVELIDTLVEDGATVDAFTAADARAAVEANAAYGTGNGRGGTLNMLDLMVYAVAKRTRRPILCTGRDFAATDAELHPASRDG